LLAAAALTLSPSQGHTQGWWQEGWALSAFGGPLTSKDSNEIFLKGEWSTDAWIVGFAVTKSLFSISPAFTVEGEAQTVRRFSGQSLSEFSGLVIGRWHMPISDRLKTDLAFGVGISYATGTGDDPGDDDPSKVMGMLMIELALKPVDWALGPFVRYQHRSSTFGLFGNDGIYDESTSFSVGVKWSF